MRILAQEAEWQRVCVLLIGLRDRGPVSQALPVKGKAGMCCSEDVGEERHTRVRCFHYAHGVPGRGVQ